MATTPSFTSTPRLSISDVSAANTNRDGTGTIVTLMAGVAAGTRIFEVAAKCLVSGASTANVIRIYLSSDSGSTWKLHREIAMASATSSASVATTRVNLLEDNLILPSASWAIGASTHIAEAYNVTVYGGDLT